MTDASARLGLPYILTGQAQKEVTHNEALNRLDAAVQLAVEDRDLTAPPALPAEAAAYLVAPGATGLWNGRDGQIAAYYNGWQFLVPRHGWRVWVADESLLLLHTGSSWTVFASTTGQSVLSAQDPAEARARLGLGSAAVLGAGSAAGNLVQLDASGKLPALDGSRLTNLPGGGGPLSIDGLTDVDTTSTPPGDGQALVWSAGAGLWTPGTVSGGSGGSWQPLDADLTALAALASTGLVERTGSGSAGTVPITAAGKALLDDADAAAQRATLGLGAAATLSPGTTAGALVQLDAGGKLPAVDGSQLTNLPSAGGAQPADATLSALAGLSTDTNTLPYFTGADTAQTTPLTAFARTLLDDADAAAARATLAAAAASTAQTFSGGQRSTVTTLTDAATIAIDMSLSNDFTVTLGGNRTMANPSNAAPGQSGLIALVQDATGGRTVAWGANWDWEGGMAPALSSAGGAVDVIAYWCRSAGSIIAALAVKGAA